MNLHTHLTKCDYHEPTTLTQTLKDHKWCRAMSEEFDDLVKDGTWCHAPIPDPTRMADPNRVRARDYILGLIDLFFLRAELVPVVIQTISVITKIIFIYKKNYHHSGVHQNLYTYTESHLLIHVHFFFLIQNIRDRGSSAVSTYL